MTIKNEVRNSWHDSIVELFELDLSAITEDASDVYYFTGDIFPDGRKIQWQGQIYEPFPIAITGFETTTRGIAPQPELTVANVLGTLASAVNSFDDLVGAKITRRRTLGKYLDNGTSPDQSEEFPFDIYYIERKVSENNLSITWQLASKIDLEGLQLPKRIVTQNYCIWKYRGEECGYSGPPVANERDEALKGDESLASQTYLNAIKTFNNARAVQRAAQYQLSATTSRLVNDCDPATRPIRRTFSRLDANNPSFALVSNGQPLFGVVQGTVVNLFGVDPDYRATRTVRTNFGEEDNETGTVYQIDFWKLVPKEDEEAEDEFEIDRSFFSTTAPISFAFNLREGDPVFVPIVAGQIVELVSEGEGFRLGPPRAVNVAQVTAIGLIDKNPQRCAEAQDAYDSAQAALDTATANLQAASDAVDAAAAALPSNSALFQEDVCGKRLNSCKLRFGRRELPFGGFPGANLTR